MRAILALTLILAACAPDTRTADATRCTGYGFTAGTADYANCLMRLDIARRAMIVHAFSADY